MANDISIRKTLSSEIENTSIINGSIIFCSDTNKIYFDTQDGERILIANSIQYLIDDEERKQTPGQTNTLYVVRSTGRMWIYTNSMWVNINPPVELYFDLDNVEIPVGETGITISDDRITSDCNASFSSIEALYDIANAENVTITCTCNNGSVTAISTCQYPLIGKIKIIK